MVILRIIKSTRILQLGCQVHRFINIHTMKNHVWIALSAGIANLVVLFCAAPVIAASKTDSLISVYHSDRSNDSVKRNLAKIISDEYITSNSLNDSALIWIEHVAAENDLGVAYKYRVSRSLLLGKFYLRKSEFANALTQFYKALQISRDNSYDAGTAHAYLQIAIVFYIQKQYTEAITNFQSSEDVYNKLNDKHSISTVNYLTGLSYTELGDFKKSEVFLQNALTGKQSDDDIKGIYECKLALANIYLKTHQFEKSSALYNECLLYFTTRENQEGVAIANSGIGKLAMEKGDLVKAEQLLLKALDIVKKFKYNERTITILNELNILYRKKGDFEKALKFQTDYYALKDSIFNDANAQTISFLKSKIEIDKQHAEIEALQHKQKVAKFQRIGGIAIIIFLLAYLYNLYKRYAFKKRAEAKLSDANQSLQNSISELRATQKQLIHSEKMASMGRLTSGIAHELRNPLNFVANFSKVSDELLHELVATDDKDEKQQLTTTLINNLNTIQTHSKRADSIIRNMLQLSRKSHIERTDEQFNYLVEEYTRVACRNYSVQNKGFTCRLHFESDPLIETVEMNSHEITGVILSITHNAMDAMLEKKSFDAQYDPELKVKTWLHADNAYASFTDNGIGINDKIIGKVFEPFFTTKPFDKGTGLGLSLCYDFIKIHQGDIYVSSVENETTFTFFLPQKTKLANSKIN